MGAELNQARTSSAAASGASGASGARSERVVHAPSRWPAALHRIDVRVYYEDTDAGGIVYHANYLRYFERARTDWLRSLGVVHRELAEREGIGFVVKALSIDYRAPARLDDQLRIDVHRLQLRPASLHLGQTARCGDALLVVADLRLAAISTERGRPIAFPSWLLEKMSQ